MTLPERSGRGAGVSDYTVRVTFQELLKKRGLTAYRVAAEGRGQVSRNAVYALARGEADRVDLGTLGKLAGLLERLTGQEVNISDLLTFEPAAAPSARKPRSLTVAQELVAALPDHPIERQHLLAALPEDVNQGTAGREIQFLCPQGYVTKPSRGVYLITEKGKQARAQFLALAAAEGGQP